MKLKVWLDDERPMPAGYDLHVKTAEEAIRILSAGDVGFISLDHDLGMTDPAGDGYKVACYIEKMAYEGGPRISWEVHSANAPGAARMRAALEQADKYWEERHATFEERLTYLFYV